MSIQRAGGGGRRTPSLRPAWAVQVPAPITVSIVSSTSIVDIGSERESGPCAKGHFKNVYYDKLTGFCFCLEEYPVAQSCSS